MERKHVTIGIVLEPHIAKNIATLIAPWRSAPITWHAPDSMHIALLPIGWVSETDVARITDTVRTVAAEVPASDVTFTRFAATHKDPRITDPRSYNIVRLEGEPSEMLRVLHERIARTLHMAIKPKKHFRPFVTAGHMRVAQWRALPVYPQIDVSVKLMMDITHISILERVHHDERWIFTPLDVISLA